MPCRSHKESHTFLPSVTPKFMHRALNMFWPLRRSLVVLWISLQSYTNAATKVGGPTTCTYLPSRSSADSQSDPEQKALHLLQSKFKDGVVPKSVFVRLLGEFAREDHVKNCLVHMADKFSKADVRLVDFFEDVLSWHECESDEQLKEALGTGTFKQWCSSPDLAHNLKTIQKALQFERKEIPPDMLTRVASAREDHPERHHGSSKPFLKDGTQVRLDPSAVGKETASSWQPLDTTMLRCVCLVGPGEEQLDLQQLERIRNGQHWVEFGILFGHHGVPERKPNAKEGGTLRESYDYASKASDVILKKYPRLTRIAEVLQQQEASSRMRFCAHLLEDPFDRHLLEENGGEFLRWLVECGFRKVLLHLNSNIRDYSESQVEDAVKKLQNMMERYKDKDFTLVLSVPDNIMDKAKMLLNRLLQQGPATKVSALYNSSRGGGAESTVYRPPVRDTKLHVTGYAGGFDPDNVVRKLADLRLIIPEGRQIFIEAQSKLRQNATKDCPGDFSIDLCRKFVREVAGSDFNPGMCREVYAQHDGSIILGSFDPPLILEPDHLYTVTSLEKSMFSLRRVVGEDKVTPPIAGSVATRFLLSVTDGGCKVLPPQLERPGDWKRMQQDKYLFPPVTADQLRDFLQKPCRSCLKVVRAYRGETPLGYLRTLLEASEDEIHMAKAIPPRDDDYATNLIRRWSQGLVASMDDGAGGQGHVSVASAGFGSRARKCNVFKSRDEDGLAGRGVAIVSIPGANSELYNTVTRICLEDGMHFAIVWRSEWGDAWFYAWLRSVTEAMLHGCVPLLFSSQQPANL